jgi:hypothetical protein
MWIFTTIADAYDKTRSENLKFLQDVMHETAIDGVGGLVVWSTAAAAWYLNFVAGGVAGGLVDVLRIGDGVQKGGWGYGQDALRLLMFAGPLMRVGRYGLALVAAVDETANVGNCTWIGATRAARLTGVKHFARLGDVAKAAGEQVKDTGGAVVSELQWPLTNLGAEVKPLGAFSSMDQVVNAARANPNGVVMFSVEWQMGGKQVGHTLLATRGPMGIIKIIDRSGTVVDSLAELEPLYQDISTATVYADAAVVQNAKIVTLLNEAPSILNVIAVEVRSVQLGDTTYVDIRKKSVIGRWKFEIPAWKPSSEASRYAEGWRGNIEFQGGEGALSGRCFWTSNTGGQRHNGSWSVTVSEELREILTFQFEDDDPNPAKRRKFTAPVGNTVCQGSYKNPGWPDGWFRISR